MYLVTPDGKSLSKFDSIVKSSKNGSFKELVFFKGKRVSGIIDCGSESKATEYFDKIASAIEEGIPLVKL